MNNKEQITQPQINFEVLGNIALIEFIHGKVNAFDLALCQALNQALKKAIQQDTINAILISGQETCFSAGFNLQELTNETTSDTLLSQGMNIILTLLESPKPIIAAACGHAIALGSIILLACDYRVGSPNHKFGMNEVALGLPMPQFALTLGLARLTVPARNNILLHGNIINGTEAREAGLLDEIIDNNSVVDIALTHAQRLAKLPRIAYTQTKQMLYGDTIKHIKKHKTADKKTLLQAINNGLISIS